MNDPETVPRTVAHRHESVSPSPMSAPPSRSPMRLDTDPLIAAHTDQDDQIWP